MLCGKRVFADITKLRIFRWRYHPGIFIQLLNPMTNVLIRERQKEIGDKQKRWQCDHRGKDWSEAAPHQECQRPSEARHGFSPRVRQRLCSPTSRLICVRQYIFFFLSLPGYGHLLQLPQETNTHSLYTTSVLFFLTTL